MRAAARAAAAAGCMAACGSPPSACAQPPGTHAPQGFAGSRFPRRPVQRTLRSERPAASVAGCSQLAQAAGQRVARRLSNSKVRGGGFTAPARSAKSAVRVVKHCGRANKAGVRGRLRCWIQHASRTLPGTRNRLCNPAALLLHSKQQKQLAQQFRQDVWRTVT